MRNKKGPFSFTDLRRQFWLAIPFFIYFHTFFSEEFATFHTPFPKKGCYFSHPKKLYFTSVEMKSVTTTTSRTRTTLSVPWSHDLSAAPQIKQKELKESNSKTPVPLVSRYIGRRSGATSGTSWRYTQTWVLKTKALCGNCCWIYRGFLMLRSLGGTLTVLKRSTKVAFDVCLVITQKNQLKFVLANHIDILIHWNMVPNFS